MARSCHIPTTNRLRDCSLCFFGLGEWTKIRATPYSLLVIGPTRTIPLLDRARIHGGRVAVVDSQGSFNYDQLLDASGRVASALLAGRKDLQEERVAVLIAPGYPWVAVQRGIWLAGGVAVPLPLNSARPELEYFIDDTKASTLVVDQAATSLLAPIAAARNIRILSYEQFQESQPAELREIASARRAMILYTSGTTSRPKGVV